MKVGRLWGWGTGVVRTCVMVLSLQKCIHWTRGGGSYNKGFKSVLTV